MNIKNAVQEYRTRINLDSPLSKLNFTRYKRTSFNIKEQGGENEENFSEWHVAGYVDSIRR